jgi:hypothetical protein
MYGSTAIGLSVADSIIGEKVIGHRPEENIGRRASGSPGETDGIGEGDIGVEIITHMKYKLPASMISRQFVFQDDDSFLS